MALSAGWRLGNYYEENDTVPTDFPPSPIWPQNNEQDAFFPSLHLSGRRILELYTKTPRRTVDVRRSQKYTVIKVFIYLESRKSILLSGDVYVHMSFDGLFKKQF